MSGKGPYNTPLKRYSLKNIRTAILNELNLEKGMLYTLVNLIKKPGVVINEHLFEDRNKMVKPIPYLFLTAGFVTFITLKFIDFENEIDLSQLGSQPGEFQYNLVVVFKELVSKYYNINLLFNVPFFALGSFLMFQDRKFNYAEHLVVAAYLTGSLFIFNAAFIPFMADLVSGARYIPIAIFFIITQVYSAYLIIKVFKVSVKIGVLKYIGLILIANSISSIVTFGTAAFIAYFLM